MQKNPFVRIVHTRTVQNKFNIIIGLIVVILLFSLLDFWFGIKVMSGIRGYVGGEGLWSKAQKEALSSLVRYSGSGDEADYQKFVQLTMVQEGDKSARLELDKPNPNYDVITDGFVKGGNDPGDINDMVFLYRQFHQVSYMKEAIKTWRSGDVEIANMVDIADQIHSLLQSKPDLIQVGHGTDRAKLLVPLLAKSYTIDARLTILENHFSAALGLGSRRISDAMLRLTVFATIMLGLLTVTVALVIARAITRLDKLKSEFVSLASHQLRTPLTAINWYTEALLSGSKGQLTPTQQEYLGELSSGGHRMSSLISDLLRVSSLDLGTYHAEAKHVQIDALLNAVLKDLKPAIDQKGLLLETRIDPDLPKTKLDDQLLTATFQNLLSNSVKYTPNGGRITVDVNRQRQNLLIHVGDNGIGIPSGQQSLVFTKLFRADNAKQLDADGTGLGLYIVYALADRLGGRAWFKSVEGKGSDFYVKLPIYRGINDRHNN